MISKINNALVWFLSWSYAYVLAGLPILLLTLVAAKEIFPTLSVSFVEPAVYLYLAMPVLAIVLMGILAFLDDFLNWSPPG